MSRITCAFLLLAVVYLTSCNPIDEISSSVKPSTTLNASTQPTKDIKANNKKHDHNSNLDDSKESDESSEEVQKRPVRDTPPKETKTQQERTREEQSQATKSEVPPKPTKEFQLPGRETQKPDTIPVSIKRSENLSPRAESSSTTPKSDVTRNIKLN